MNTHIHSNAQAVVHQWRLTILNGFIVVAALAAAAGMIMTIFDTASSPGQWPSVILYAVLLVILAVLASFRKIDSRIRTWGVLLVAYITGLITLTTLGLGGSGRLYLLALPVVALILLGVRSGIIMSVIGIITMLTYALMAGYTSVLDQLITERSSLSMADWLAESSDTLMLLVVTMVLLILFYRFQERTLNQERRAQAELHQAQELLQEQNITLEQKVKERTAELVQSNKIQTALYEITSAASTSRDMQEFYTRIHHIVGELMYARNLFIALYDQSTGMMSYPYFVDEKNVHLHSQPLDNDRGMTGYVIRTGNPIKHGWSRHAGQDALPDVDLAGMDAEDCIGVPLIAEGKILGAIFVQSYAPQVQYTDQDDEILSFVAQHIATALTRARLLETEHQRNYELSILSSVGEAMAETLDVKTVTRIVGDKVLDIFQTGSVIIMLVERPANLIYIVYEYDKNEGGYIDYVEPFPLGTGLSSKVILSGQPLLVGTLEEEIANGAYFPPEIIEQGTGNFSQSWLGVPVIMRNEVLGLVALSDYRAHAFNENHLHILQTLSSNIGVAIENARLFQAEKQRAAELAAINTVSAALASELDLNALISLVGEQTRSRS